MPRRPVGDPAQLDLFSVIDLEEQPERLSSLDWPDASRFPLNRPGTSVRRTIWPDLVGSSAPVLVAGYSSLGTLIDLIADWTHHPRTPDDHIRVVLGSEPFAPRRTTFASPEIRFAKEVHDYWHGLGFSLERSAKVVAARQAVTEGQVRVRANVRSPALHAKVFLGDRASTIGSSNFTMTGLERQIEANARFDSTADSKRHRELKQIGQNLWDAADDWNAEFLELLDELLQVVTWQEALARACGELLDGDWLDADGRPAADQSLWPSQVLGIAQAMWIVERVGSVLVADATGSGKTKMGAHLVRSVRDRLFTTGRMRNQLTVLVCPPSVQETWQREALSTGLSLDTISHGRLSRTERDDGRLEGEQVRQAQLLAVDEAHNFLNAGSKRTQRLRDNAADHVLLFTATPISRGAPDLLDLVALLGPDNFDDETHAILRRLERRRAVNFLGDDDVAQLRREIQRFTLRRTKRQINRLVDAEPQAFRHPVTDRVCRYPVHIPKTYSTGETTSDVEAAMEIRDLAIQLEGITQLTRKLDVPQTLRGLVTDEAWLRFQLRSAAGLAAHHVLAALRSSRAALHEHLLGTAEASAAFRLSGSAKSAPTGDVIGKLKGLERSGCPDIRLDTDLPIWLTDRDAWQARCREELDRYRGIVAALGRIGGAREEAKAGLLSELVGKHDRVLAFDRHPTTLMVLHDLLGNVTAEVLIATGRANSERSDVQTFFAPDADIDRPVIALCSDAMSEGLNLQAASALVHLDLPTTLRVAEQRVGRVDRMDSRHDEIEAWWPKDGVAFATRANERLTVRLDESQRLLGSNLEVPDLSAFNAEETAPPDREDLIIDPVELHRETEAALAEPTDQLVDALEQVRALVEGEEPLVPRHVYERMRDVTARVLSRVAPVHADHSWSFLSVRSSGRGVPRWIWVEPQAENPCETDLAAVVDRVYEHLASDPPGRQLDDNAADQLEGCLRLAARYELHLLPRRSQRALTQMGELTRTWAKSARKVGDEGTGQRWLHLSELARPDPSELHADPFSVAEAWLELVAPRLEAHRARTRGRKYALLGDIGPSLRREPFNLDDVEQAMEDLPMAQPLAERVSVCILGVPDPRQP